LASSRASLIRNAVKLKPLTAILLESSGNRSYAPGSAFGSIRQVLDFAQQFRCHCQHVILNWFALSIVVNRWASLQWNRPGCVFRFAVKTPRLARLVSNTSDRHGRQGPFLAPFLLKSLGVSFQTAGWWGSHRSHSSLIAKALSLISTESWSRTGLRSPGALRVLSEGRAGD